MAATAIKIIEKNIQYLKSCLDLTESHITGGTKNVKEKYSKVKERLTNKMREQLVDKRYYQSLIR
jgi:hypothetical protein